MMLPVGTRKYRPQLWVVDGRSLLHNEALCQTQVPRLLLVRIHLLTWEDALCA